MQQLANSLGAFRVYTCEPCTLACSFWGRSCSLPGLWWPPSRVLLVVLLFERCEGVFIVCSCLAGAEGACIASVPCHLCTLGRVLQVVEGACRQATC